MNGGSTKDHSSESEVQPKVPCSSFLILLQDDRAARHSSTKRQQSVTVWLLHFKDLHFYAKPRTFVLLSGLPGNCFEVLLPWDVCDTPIPLLKPDVLYPHLHEEPFILAGPLSHPWMPAEAEGEDFSETVHLSQPQGFPTFRPDLGSTPPKNVDTDGLGSRGLGSLSKAGAMVSIKRG